MAFAGQMPLPIPFAKLKRGPQQTRVCSNYHWGPEQIARRQPEWIRCRHCRSKCTVLLLPNSRDRSGKKARIQSSMGQLKNELASLCFFEKSGR